MIKIVLIAFCLVALIFVALIVNQLIEIHPWQGCAYQLNCCPESGAGGLCYLEEGRIQYHYPVCPDRLRPVSAVLECSTSGGSE